MRLVARPTRREARLTRLAKRLTGRAGRVRRPTGRAGQVRRPRPAARPKRQPPRAVATPKPRRRPSARRKRRPRPRTRTTPAPRTRTRTTRSPRSSPTRTPRATRTRTTTGPSRPARSPRRRQGGLADAARGRRPAPLPPRGAAVLRGRHDQGPEGRRQDLRHPPPRRGLRRIRPVPRSHPPVDPRRHRAAAREHDGEPHPVPDPAGLDLHLRPRRPELRPPGRPAAVLRPRSRQHQAGARRPARLVAVRRADREDGRRGRHDARHAAAGQGPRRDGRAADADRRKFVPTHPAAQAAEGRRPQARRGPRQGPGQRARSRKRRRQGARPVTRHRHARRDARGARRPRGGQARPDRRRQLDPQPQPLLGRPPRGERRGRGNAARRQAVRPHRRPPAGGRPAVQDPPQAAAGDGQPARHAELPAGSTCSTRSCARSIG